MGSYLKELAQVLEPLRRRMRLMISRAVVNLVYDGLKMQGLQVSIFSDETLDGIERFQNYGFTSNPQTGAEAIVVNLAGRRDHAVAIVVDDRRYRLKNLAPGEVALYTDEGDYVWFKRGGNIEIQADTKVKVTAPEVDVIASTKVKLDTPLVEVTGALTATGQITGNGGMAISGGTGATINGNVAFGGGTLTHGGVNIGGTHVHGGVQVGGGNTAVPH